MSHTPKNPFFSPYLAQCLLFFLAHSSFPLGGGVCRSWPVLFFLQRLNRVADGFHPCHWVGLLIPHHARMYFVSWFFFFSRLSALWLQRRSFPVGE